MIGLVTQQARDVQARQAVEKNFAAARPYLDAGHARNSPGNPASPSQAVHQVGERVGHQAHGEQTTVHGVDVLQVGDRSAAAPQALAEIRTAPAASCSGPAFPPGTAAVARLDYAQRAGGASPLAPSGKPAQPAQHIAPNQPQGTQ